MKKPGKKEDCLEEIINMDYKELYEIIGKLDIKTLVRAIYRCSFVIGCKLDIECSNEVQEQAKELEQVIEVIIKKYELQGEG